MNSNVQSKIFDINRRFYEQFAPSFSITRDRVQPGVRGLLPQLSQAGRVLDVGCGNGTLARALSGTTFAGQYLGTDLSEGLLREAESLSVGIDRARFTFQQADLTETGWEQTLPGAPYDWLVSFAVLHHLPGESLRKTILEGFTRLIDTDSRVAVSVWQWQNSPRLHKHVIPWSEVGLADSDVDEGDVLLDWRAADQIGIRYVHTYSEESLTALAQTAGFEVLESYYSDGKPGNLALYQVWQKAK